MAEIKAIKIGNNTYQIGADVNESLANSFTGGTNILRGTRFPQMSTNAAVIDESWNYSKFVSYNPDEHSKGDLAFPSEYIDECPANNECERCGTVQIEACSFGICQTVHHYPVESSLTKIIKTRNTTVGGNVEYQTVTRIPLTFSFYARSTGSSSTLRVAPVLFQDSEQWYFSDNNVIDSNWTKVSVTTDYDMDKYGVISVAFSDSMLGFILCIDGSVCEVACMSLTFGEYDIDWQPNPLDAKSAIIGIDNLLQGTEELPSGEGYGKFTPLYNEDFYTYSINKDITSSAIEYFPGAESYTGIIKGIEVYLNKYTPMAGFTQIYHNPKLDLASMCQTALTDVISNAETDIPVSMSIWVLAEADVQVGLMPLCYNNTLFAPASYSYVTADKWTRLTRTIYIPAGVTIDDSTKLRIGSVLAIGEEATVIFTRPMVTLGSIPSTWAPSYADTISKISTVTDELSDKVSKSGDTMSGDLDMAKNSINNVNTITASDTTNGIVITGGIDTTNAGFKVSGTAGTYSKLMQGDGKFRAIGANSYTDIPTWLHVAEATGVYWASVSISAAMTFYLPPTRRSYHYYGTNTSTAVTLTINPAVSVSFIYNFHYFTINQSTNTCTVTLASSNYAIKTKGNITSFTVAAGQSIEFCVALYNGYIYVTYTLFG